MCVCVSARQNSVVKENLRECEQWQFELLTAAAADAFAVFSLSLFPLLSCVYTFIRRL